MYIQFMHRSRTRANTAHSTARRNAVAFEQDKSASLDDLKTSGLTPHILADLPMENTQENKKRTKATHCKSI